MKAPSLSARRAWIEISVVRYSPTPAPVALRKESVDRNSVCGRSWLFGLLVALRKESVDRNVVIVSVLCVTGVALRKESVDRNTSRLRNVPAITLSLSARRAWIEILLVIQWARHWPSLSARRAWIEMLSY